MDSRREDETGESFATGCVGFLGLIAASTLAAVLLAIGATELMAYGLGGFLFLFVMKGWFKGAEARMSESEYQQYAAKKDQQIANAAKKQAYEARYELERGD